MFAYTLYKDIISTDEDPGLRIESFAIVKIHGVSTGINYTKQQSVAW